MSFHASGIRLVSKVLRLATFRRLPLWETCDNDMAPSQGADFAQRSKHADDIRQAREIVS